MDKLSESHCVPCSGNVSSLKAAEINAMLSDMQGWEKIEVEGEPRLIKEYKFKNFIKALNFTNKIGSIAEEEGHHPAILTEWGKVTVSWWTHAIQGLHRNDFIMAAKTDQLFQREEQN